MRGPKKHSGTGYLEKANGIGSDISSGACKDKVTFYLFVTEDVVKDVKSVADGCKDTISFCSFMNSTLIGRNVRDVNKFSRENLLFCEAIPDHSYEVCINALKLAVQDYESKKKDPYTEALNLLSKYEEGSPDRKVRFEFEV